MLSLKPLPTFCAISLPLVESLHSNNVLRLGRFARFDFMEFLRFGGLAFTGLGGKLIEITLALAGNLGTEAQEACQV